MKIVFMLFTALLFAVLFEACSSSKDVAYFQDIEMKDSLVNYNNYEPRIKKDDILSIIVSGPDKEVVSPFNNEQRTYTVDANGYINFPILGMLHVQDLTLRELSEKLKNEISKDVKNPTVSISFENYKVTVLGEVSSPGTYTMPGEKTTILQALGMAGDLTLGAKRSNVLLIREVNGNFEHVRIDLRKSAILSSPYYYLCQNDVIYVTPTSSRTFSGSSRATMIPIITSSLSLVIATVAIILSN